MGIFNKCFLCGKIKFHTTEYTWETGPGSGRTADFCNSCYPHRPKSFSEIMGITSKRMEPEAKFFKYIGDPRITASDHGLNAYGSVLALYTDGSTLPVICGHGGSAWFCLTCAKKTMGEEHGKEKEGM